MKRVSKGQRVETRRWHEDELLRFRDGVIMDLDGDAATCPRNPSKGVELTAELWYQQPRLLHRFALQISLRMRCCSCSSSVHCQRCHLLCSWWEAVLFSSFLIVMTTNGNWLMMNLILFLFYKNIFLLEKRLAMFVCDWNCLFDSVRV